MEVHFPLLEELLQLVEASLGKRKFSDLAEWSGRVQPRLLASAYFINTLVQVFYKGFMSVLVVVVCHIIIVVYFTCRVLSEYFMHIIVRYVLVNHT